MPERFAPSLAAAQARIAAVRPAAYARTRNALDGAVTGLSPYITHGLVTLTEVLAGVNARQRLDSQRMWLASYVVHVRKVHWRCGADWLYAHLLDGDLASNHLSWQWVAGTGSSKPYLFNADNVARHAPAAWHSPGTVIDTSCEALDRIARTPGVPQAAGLARASLPLSAWAEPAVDARPPAGLGFKAPDAAAIAGREVWLVHPWCLREPPPGLAPDALRVGIAVADFHQAWPWSARRWQFVGSRMAELATECWLGDATTIAAALQGARSVRSIDEPHLAPWLPQWAACEAAPQLFAGVDRLCDSFSTWWKRVTKGLRSAAELLEAQQAPAW